MKTLIATLLMSTLSLNVMAYDNPRPELDTAQLDQVILTQQQEASRVVVLDALSNLKPLALDTLVVEVNSVDATHPGS
ncbi:hypothetical protein [Aeromonas piscicola]|uniref:hypothetical protein n=1 Tax=Aeromonas piscicola TaxID=600645 RepID=UPI0021F8B2B0|nr:hypothetical protein [Aeromonas piscicola]MCW0507784.1 hypothetical protein [Aeromonas piscicola]